MKFNGLSILLLLAAGCGTSAPEPLAEFSSEYPKNYLVVHTGRPSQFNVAGCVEFANVEDVSTPRAERRLRQLFSERLPQLPGCTTQWPRLVVDYRSGRGFYIHHAAEDPSEPYSGFAFISLQLSPATLERDDPSDASAEWQYWRGGSSNYMMEQFIFDLTNLYIHGMEKPIPGMGSQFPAAHLTQPLHRARPASPSW